MEAFRNFVRTQPELQVQPAQIDEELEFAKLRLRQEIITAAFSNDAGARVLLDSDVQVLRALEALPDAKRLADSTAEHHLAWLRFPDEESPPDSDTFGVGLVGCRQRAATATFTKALDVRASCGRTTAFTAGSRCQPGAASRIFQRQWSNGAREMARNNEICPYSRQQPNSSANQNGQTRASIQRRDRGRESYVI